MGDVVSRECCMLWLSLLAATSSSQPHRSPEAGSTADQSEGDAAMTKRLSPAESLFQSWTGVCVSPVCELWSLSMKWHRSYITRRARACVRACLFECAPVLFFQSHCRLVQFNLPQTWMIYYFPPSELSHAPMHMHTCVERVLCHYARPHLCYGERLWKVLLLLMRPQNILQNNQNKFKLSTDAQM